ncbi:phage portal protein [Roseicyclus marinus]|uniref:phage portal protein n=1 Tax=Roseicyclus marinus TaxID=2161673 RepID=UPI00240F5C1B|nr:phage portal protein [Roseicyclus marinus]MDG3040449.1 phage portal protein [Roseicyclus marinus]
MAFRITRFFGRRGPQVREGIQTPDPGTYADAAAGPVTFDTAMTVSAFWAASRLISETIASMPLKSLVRDGDGWREDRDYPLWRVLNYQPNRYQTRVEFLESMAMNLCTNGNSYSAKQTDENGRLLSILPMMAAQVQPELLKSGDMIYRFTGPDGQERVYQEASIFHVKIFGNGLIGMSPLSHARQSLGIALANESRHGKMAASGGKQSGILMAEKALTPEQREAIRKEFGRITEGTSDHLFVLDAFLKYQATSLSPADIQLLQSRRFSVEDVARFMGVPSVLINDTAGSTTWGSGIQQLVQGFYKLNLRPYLERIEASIKRHLMPIEDWDVRKIEFDFDTLLRGDLGAQMEAYQKGINAGVFAPNEARQTLGLPPKAGGERLLVNGSMVPVDQVRARPLPGEPT